LGKKQDCIEEKSIFLEYLINKASESISEFKKYLIDNWKKESWHLTQ
jgi:hypothetical protein